MSKKATIGICTVAFVGMSLAACGSAAEETAGSSTHAASTGSGAGPTTSVGGGTSAVGGGTSAVGGGTSGVGGGTSGVGGGAADGGGPTEGGTSGSGGAGEASSPVAPLGKEAARITDVAIGLNYNEAAANFKPADIARIYAATPNAPKWARFIFNINKAFHELKTDGDWTRHRNWILNKFCKAHNVDPAKNVKTVLSIRWEFKNPIVKDGSPIPIPKWSPNCQKDGTCKRFQELSEFLTTQVLPTALECTDVLVIANEPSLEALKQDVNPNSDYTRFYKAITRDALERGSWKWPHHDKPFYFGAFEALWVHNSANFADDEARKELLGFVNNDYRISGIDLHMHSKTLDQLDEAFDWLNVGKKLAVGKDIIVTEFSPAPALFQDMGKTIDPGFQATWSKKDPGIKAKWTNAQYLDYAYLAPRPNDEFQAWLASLYFSKQTAPHYVCGAWGRFIAHQGRFRLAFQGATQGILGEKSDDDPEEHNEYDEQHWPWILNPIIMGVTALPDENGQRAERWHWYDDVQKILKNGSCQ